MSLDTIQGKLSRAEMKSIMAGFGPCGFMETLYYCTWSAEGMSDSGYACGFDAGTTAMEVNAVMIEEGIPDDMSVTCH